LPYHGELEEATPESRPASPVGSPRTAWLGAGPLNAQTVLALQRSAGNSAVNGLLRSAVVQRCGGAAGGCGCELCATGAQSRDADAEEVHHRLEQAGEGEALPTDPGQGVDGQAVEALEAGGAAEGGVVESVGGAEDEMAEAQAEEAKGQASEAAGRAGATKPAQRVVQRAMAQAARKRRLARTATWAAGPVHQVNNLADCVINGRAVGVTWPTLNGTQFWSGAEAGAAIQRPTLTTTAAATGGFESEVATVPTNTGSFDETVLARGPWRLNTTMAAVTAAVPGLAAACNAGGNTRFRAYGNPSDSAMFAANRRHEDHHARDHRAAFNATITPWDRALRQARRARRRFPGPTAAEAEAALWAAMGGTPDQVATAFFDGCQAAVIAFHGTARGGAVGAPTSPGARNACAISWAKYRNPS
jgi:hypothetical protein